MTFSFIATLAMVARSKRLNGKVFSLLHLIPPKIPKKEKGMKNWAV